MKKYVVMHDYGMEGWKIQGEFDNPLDAVMCREDNLQNGGGVCVVFEAPDLFDLYRSADYEKDKRARAASEPKATAP